MALEEISPGLLIADLCLYLDNLQTLVIGDVHIGYEAEMTKTGYLVPKFHFKDIVQRMENVFSILESNNKKLDKIVLVGDLKHEFGTISDEEWRNTLKFLDMLGKKCDKLVLIQGNHDTILGPIADKRNLEVVQYVLLGDEDGDIMICHGDKLFDVPPTVKRVIIGHEHPAISISDGIRTENVKCFLKGKLKLKTEEGKKTKCDLIVVPSLTQLAEGTNVLDEKLLSPYLDDEVCDLLQFEAWAIPDKEHVLYFGKLEKLENQ